MSFDKWAARLDIAQRLPTVAARRVELERLKINHPTPDEKDEGYYRKPITVRAQDRAGNNNGQWRIVNWQPVAYFLADGSLVGIIGDREMTPEERTDQDLWGSVVSNPITEALYRAVAENGENWPDLPEGILDRAMGASAIAPADIPAANREVAKTDNAPPPEEEIPPVKQHATAIANAVGVAKATKIEDDVTAAKALGIKNRLAELRLAADKAGKAVYEPLYKEYVAVRDQWTPMVKQAKDEEDALNKRYLTFRDQQRRAAEKAAAEEAAAQAAIDEANEAAAQRAIARGEPEVPPVVEPAPAPTPAPAPVQATYRAPGQRTVQEVEKWHFDEVTDWSKLIEFAKDQPEIRTAMENMAKAMVKAGRDVPGVKRHWGLV